MTGKMSFPPVSIDVVTLRRSGEDLLFALHRRVYEPFAGRLALPGVLLSPGETLEEGARRALSAKLGISGDHVTYLAQIAVSDRALRDPRGYTISIVFLAVVDDPGLSALWYRFMEDAIESPLPFDHDAILSDGFDGVHLRLWRDVDLTRALLGETFTTSDALSLSLGFGSLPTERSNMKRWLSRWGEVKEVTSPDVSLRGRDTAWSWESPITAS